MNGFTWASLSAIALFAFVSSITPGPNNIMLLHSGARFGFARSVAHMWGINLGFGVMLMLCCLGVAAVVLQVPQTQWALKVLGCGYMLWLAHKLWRNGALPANGTLPDAANKNAAQPMTLMQAALFQYVNPKAWMMALSVPATLLPRSGDLLMHSSIATAIFMVVNLLCISVWVQGGVALQKLMHSPRLAQLVNVSIVAMTVYCAASVWY